MGEIGSAVWSAFSVLYFYLNRIWIYDKIFYPVQWKKRPILYNFTSIFSHYLSALLLTHLVLKYFQRVFLSVFISLKSKKNWSDFIEFWVLFFLRLVLFSEGDWVRSYFLQRSRITVSYGIKVDDFRLRTYVSNSEWIRT